MNRRKFLKASTAGLALSSLGVYANVGSEPVKRVGLVGSGWYGKVDLLRLIQVGAVEVVSLCDVDSQMLSAAAELVASRQKSKKKPRTYKDYREMLKEKDLDIVIIGTPDHWHALPMIAAVESGADVYVQKPISVDIVEGQAMLAAAQKYKRVVQVGTQRRSTPHLIDARDRVIREGKLGEIAHVEICCYFHMRTKKNPPDVAPPAHLDWDMWTGPAPMRPYNPLVHPRGWRGFMEYGNGIVGDMCIHMLDMVRWMLDLGWPTSVSSTGGIYVNPESKANIADTQTATFAFDKLPVVWTHRAWGNPPDKEYPWAAFIYGSKGTLKASVKKWDFIPRGKGKPMHQDVILETEKYPEDKTEERLELHAAPAVRKHMTDFLSCIESRGKPVANIEEGFISTTSCILANLAMQTGRTLQWDPIAGKIANDEEANKLLQRPYREPWVHPDPKDFN